MSDERITEIGDPSRVGDGDRAMIDAACAYAEAASLQFRRNARPACTSGGAPLARDSFTGYQILGEVHRGGQGVVYLALQKGTQRKVAIKVLREGPFAGLHDRARFEREVQILGRLNHPNIVTIHDCGEAAGCCYFVMDYIDGQSLDAYMAGEERAIEETLRLFRRICDAVNAAHLRGVIHRDLKPSNIRMDASGEPHVLDFGLAKSMWRRLPAGDGSDEPHASETGATLHAESMTVTGQFVGSLPWASPEQALGAPEQVDIRTDVYSLGVILYQMLTGRFPYEVAGNMRDVLDHILNAQPVRPSTVRRQINDEVETIVLKCLSKERERRYQSAGDLARDIGCYLSGEPIAAKRDSTRYLLRKHLRRHRLAVAVGACIVLLVTGGFIVSLSFWRQAVRQRDRAMQAEQSQTRERQRAEKVAEFMSDMLKGVGPSVAQGRDTAMLREMMDAVATRIQEGELKQTPEAELQLRLTIGDTYRTLAAYDAAEQMLCPAQDLARATFGNEHAEVAAAVSLNAGLLCERGRVREALPLFEAALAMRQRLSAGDHPSVATELNNVAGCLHDLGRPDEALAVLTAALEMDQRLFKGDHPSVATDLNNVAGCLKVLGRAGEALPRFESALAMWRRLHAGDHPYIAGGMDNVASCLRALGRAKEALPEYEAALAMRQRLFRGDHPDVAAGLIRLALCLQDIGRADEALPKFEAGLASYQRLFNDDHPDVAWGLNNLGNCLRSLGRKDEALRRLDAALEMYQRIYHGDHPHVAAVLNNLAGCLRAAGRTDEALPKYEAALAMRRRILPSGHIDIHASEIGQGRTLTAMQRFAESERLLTGAYSALADHPKARGTLKKQALEALVELYEAWARSDPDKGHDTRAAEWRDKINAASVSDS